MSVNAWYQQSSLGIALSAHNGLMPGIKKNGELDLVWGIFVIGATFFASAFGALWFFVAMGLNPLSSSIQAYAGIAIALTTGALGRWGDFSMGGQ